MTARWYVLHVYSGSEKKVAESIKEQAVLKKMEDKILDVLVPTEDVVEVKKGSKVNSERKFFPGYVLIKMEMSDDTWHAVMNTPRVTGFWAAAISRSRFPKPRPNVLLLRCRKALKGRRRLSIMRSASKSG